MPKFSSIIKLLVLIVCVLVSKTSSASIPDSLNADYGNFIKVLKSNLSNQDAKDSVWHNVTWNWLDLEDQDFDEVIAILDGRINAATDLKEKVVIYHLKEHFYKQRNLIGKAVVMYGKEVAIHSVLKDTLAEMYDYHWMAWMFHDHKLYQECLIAHRKVIALTKTMALTEEIAEKKWTHGFFYSVAGWELKKPEYQDSAEKYLEEAFYQCLELKGEVHKEWAITYAMSLARNKKTETAIKIAKYGLGLSELHDDVNYLARFNKQLSHYYMSKDMEDSAYFYIYESARYEEQMYPENDPSLINLGEANGSLHLYNIGFLIDINNHFGHVESSLMLLEKLIDGPDKIKDQSLLNYYRKMAASTQKLNGDFESAIHNYELYVDFNDSTFRSNSDKALKVKTAQLESTITVEKEKASEEKKQLDKIAEKEKENLRIVIYSAVVVAIIMVLFLILMYRRFKVTSRQKLLIEKQKNLVESAYQKLDVQNTEILDSINYAKRIQSAILPSKGQIQEHLSNSFIVYLPKDIVAGDFYWLEQTEDKIIFAAADCTGHGVPGAMVSVICNNGLNRSVREMGITVPGEILDATRTIVIDEFSKSDEKVNDGMDIALCALDKFKNSDGSTTLEFAGANNPLWVIRKNTYEIEVYKGNRQPVGKYLHIETYTTHSLQLNKGDQVFVFSDGFADQFGGEKGKKYYTSNFKKFLLQIRNLTLEQQKEALTTEFNRWRGDIDQVDDVCIIGLKIS